MKCLSKYKWVKVPRDEIPDDTGILIYYLRLASRAAFRKGFSRYCGHKNAVEAGSWAGGVVGLKSILKAKSRRETLEIMDELKMLGYIDYTIDPSTKKLTYSITDWVIKCSGKECPNGNVYNRGSY